MDRMSVTLNRQPYINSQVQKWVATQLTIMRFKSAETNIFVPGKIPRFLK